ncbi:hypothetical protein FRC17_009679 [Serendipita sp. 399]|nr:hypothetical protein FRC17_009679 [Serendipita sp. 399]
MPVKMRRTGSRAASSTNIVNKTLAALAATQGENEKQAKRRTMSSHAIHQHQPSALTKTSSLAKIHGNKTNGKHGNNHNEPTAEPGQGADDDDWVSSSSAMASPAPEPNDEEEDELIYVNPTTNGRHSHHHPTFPTTPKLSNQQGLPHQRHHISDHETALNPKVDLVPVTAAEYARGIHPSPTVADASQLPQNQPFTGPNHIRFAGAPTQEEYHVHAPDPRIHHHGVAHHASPPPVVNPIDSPVEEVESDQPSTSVIRITESPVSGLRSHKADSTNQVRHDEKQRDDGRNSKPASARLQQDQIDAYVGQIATTNNNSRSAISGNGTASDHVGQEVGRNPQRGFGAVPVQPFTPTVPDASSSQPSPAARDRPSMLRRDTTPTAISRSPITVDTPPRSQTPPATMTHDEMVALNNKRHSIHSTGGNRRPLSLFQPSISAKRHSVTSKSASQHGHPNPLSLIVRMNTTQGGNHALAAPPALSPSYDKDGDASYVSMSPTRSRPGQSIRRRGSVASLSSIATAPVTTFTSAATARGATASPTSAHPTTSSDLLHNLTAKPTKHLSITSRSDVRPDIRRTSQLYYKSDESPLFVSQFCAKKHPRSEQDGGSRSLGEEMAGPDDWSSHLTIMRYRHPMLESMHRISVAKAEASRLK